MYKLIYIILITLLVMSCSTTSNNKFRGGDTQRNQSGWKNDNTYEMVTVGGWDRERYYMEGTEVKEGKKAKSELLLREDAKVAAIQKAKREFLEKVVGAYVKSETGVEDGSLTGDIIKSLVDGVVPSPISLKENYTKGGDVRITFQFTAQNLKKIISDAANKILKEKNQKSSDNY